MVSRKNIVSFFLGFYSLFILIVKSHPTSLLCTQRMDVGSIIMGYPVIYDTSRFINVTRSDGSILLSGDNYIPGEVLTVSLSYVNTVTEVNFVFQVNGGGQFINTGTMNAVCSNTRILSVDLSNGANLVTPSSGQISLFVTWGEIYGQVSSSSDSMFILSPLIVPTAEPSISLQPSVSFEPSISLKPSIEPSISLEPWTISPTSEPSLVPLSVFSSSAQPSIEPLKSVQPSTISPSVKPSTFLTSTKPSLVPLSVSSTSVQPSVEPSIGSNNGSTNPSVKPSTIPYLKPLSLPTTLFSTVPSIKSSTMPSVEPTLLPTCSTTRTSSAPSTCPSWAPSISSSFPPSQVPSHLNSLGPTTAPTTVSCRPTSAPSSKTSSLSSFCPSVIPSCSPSTSLPTNGPTYFPSIVSTCQSSSPTLIPSMTPSNDNSMTPSSTPSSIPSFKTSLNPTIGTTKFPTTKPSLSSNTLPSAVPSITVLTTSPPSSFPSVDVTMIPTLAPSGYPSSGPTSIPSNRPITIPSCGPTATPSFEPTKIPTVVLSALPTGTPSTLSPSSSRTPASLAPFQSVIPISATPTKSTIPPVTTVPSSIPMQLLASPTAKPLISSCAPSLSPSYTPSFLSSQYPPHRQESQASFTVTELFKYAYISQFLDPLAVRVLNSTFQNITNGVTGGRILQISIVQVEQLTASARHSLELQAATVKVKYNVSYTFAGSLSSYYSKVVQQLQSSVASKSFNKVFRRYTITYGSSLTGAVADSILNISQPIYTYGAPSMSPVLVLYQTSSAVTNTQPFTVAVATLGSILAVALLLVLAWILYQRSLPAELPATDANAASGNDRQKQPFYDFFKSKVLNTLVKPKKVEPSGDPDVFGFEVLGKDGNEQSEENNPMYVKSEDSSIDQVVPSKVNEDGVETSRLAEQIQIKRIEAETERIRVEAEVVRMAEELELKKKMMDSEAQRLDEKIRLKKQAVDAEIIQLREQLNSKRIFEETESKRLAEATSKLIFDQIEAKKRDEEAKAKKIVEDAEAKRFEMMAEIKRLTDTAEAKKAAVETEVRRITDELFSKRMANRPALFPGTSYSPSPGHYTGSSSSYSAAPALSSAHDIKRQTEENYEKKRLAYEKAYERRRLEEQDKRRRDEEALLRQQAEEQRARKLEEEAIEARRLQEHRIEEEAFARRHAEQMYARRIAEDEARRQTEARRQAEEAYARRQAEVAHAMRLAEEEARAQEAKRLKDEADARKRAFEEAEEKIKLFQESEIKRKAQESDGKRGIFPSVSTFGSTNLPPLALPASSGISSIYGNISAVPPAHSMYMTPSSPMQNSFPPSFPSLSAHQTIPLATSSSMPLIGSNSMYGASLGGGSMQMSPHDAWNILLQPGNIYDQMSLGNILTSIGVSSDSDLSLCQSHEIMSIAQTLSPIARISFLRIFGLS